MSNRIPTHAQTWYADSLRRDENGLRVERNRRRNARKAHAKAGPSRVPFLVWLANQRGRREALRWIRNATD